MPGADGEVIYQVRADTSNLQGDLENANKETEKQTGKLKEISAGAAIAVGASFISVAAAGTYVVNYATDMDKAINSFLSSTGTATAETEKYKSVLEKIYANNYGEDFNDIAEGMAQVQKNIDGLSDDGLQQITESAFVLRDQFEYEIPESTRAAKAMMDNFGISGEDAMSLIAAGAQNGLDYSGELLDNISEYSVQFAKIGFNADDMFKIFQKGAENGAFNLDKVGDAVKEFSIRAIDGSKTTIDGFNKIGLNADEMSSKFAEGGDTAKEAFYQTMQALADIEDPLEQNTAGVDLFGTMWEDLGPEAVTALADIKNGAYDTGDALNTIKDVKYDDLGSMLDALKRSVELLALPLGEMLIPVLTNIIQDILPILKEQLPVLIDGLSKFLPPLMQMGSELIPIIINLLIQITPLIMDMMNSVLPILLDAISALLPVFSEIIQQLLPPLIELFSSLMPIIVQLAQSLIPPLVAIFQALMPPIMQIIKALLPPLIELFSALMPLISALTPVIAFLADAFSKKLSDGIKAVMPIIENFIKYLSDVIKFITDVFTGNWSAAWDDIKQIVVDIFNGIITAVESGINGAIDIINGLIRNVNKLTDTVGIPHIHEIPDLNLPKFHTGGIVDFDGSYEGIATLKSGEMILTQDQQKRLFDIANGINHPTSGYYSSNSSESNITINNNQTYNVRSDYDIKRISEDLKAESNRIISGKGG